MQAVSSSQAFCLRLEEECEKKNKKKKLVFPRDIVITKLRPAVVLWSTTAKLAYFEELTVQWEDGVEEVYERKCFKYNLKNEATEAVQNG